MLNLVTYEKFNKESAIDKFEIGKQTWIVADLNAKNLLQEQLLKSHTCLPEDCVLRMSEWVRKLLLRASPDIEIVSANLITAILDEWLKKKEFNVARYPGSAGLLYHYLGELLPLLLHEESIERARDWLKENQGAFLRWGYWFELCVEAWAYFKNEKLISAQWMSAYLSGIVTNEKLWEKSLIVDVGVEFAGVEIDILKSISKFVNVDVITPSIDSCEIFNSTLWPYNVLRDKSYSLNSKAAWAPKDLNKIKCRRYTTQLSEVKAATSQVRQWLEEGCLPHELGVISPDIEEYWPVLHHYFEVEGIPAFKSNVISTTALPKVTQWISRLQIESNNIESGTLEASVYSQAEFNSISYEKFKQLFSNIYDSADLNREKSVREIFELQFKNDEKISRDQFISWAIKFVFSDIEGIQAVLTQLMIESPATLTLNLKSWLSYLASIAAQTELTIGEGSSCGVHILSLNAAASLSLKHVVLIGLSEKKLKLQSHTSMNSADVQKIASDLGVYLNSPDRTYYECLVDRVLQLTSRSSELYYAASDFAGEPQAPALIWLQSALLQKKDIEKYDIPNPTRWDEIQLGAMNNEMVHAVLMDLGLKVPEPLAHDLELKYSISQIEKYITCPFIFTTEKLFHLSDLPDVDLDIDAMTSGRLIHGVLERIMVEPVQFDLNQQKIANLVDEVRAQIGFVLSDERLWELQKNNYIKIVGGFIKFEKEWRKNYPHTLTVAREIEVATDWPLSDGQIVKFRGRIDRVDTSKMGDASKKEYVLLDYKMSKFNLHNVKSWLNHDEFQLLFYSLAIDEGWTSLERGKISGAFYYTLKQLQRDKGMRIADFGSGLLPSEEKSKNTITTEEYHELKKILKDTITGVIHKIRSGDLSPRPKDDKTCHECHWRTLCRAPHLN